MAQDHQQQLIEALPQNGEISYEDLHRQLLTTGRGNVLNQFHRLRRSRAISVRTEDGKLFVSRSTGGGTTPASQNPTSAG